MKINTTTHLRLLILGTSLLPVLLFFICAAGFKIGYLYALLIAAAAALAAVFFAAGQIMAGLAAPMVKVSSSVKCFITADYKLEAAIHKEGWPEAESLISSVNRLMLELSAYRAFQLNQVLEERGKAEALIETIVDGVLLVDDRGFLIYSNDTALQLLGIPKRAPDVVLPASVKNNFFAAAIKDIMESREICLKMDVDVGVPGEDYDISRSFRITARQFLSATLKRPGRVIVIRDVTVEKEIESSRETFFHMITHDMRAPLTSIQGYAQMLGKYTESSPEGTKFLKVILRAAHRLNGMIADILNTIKLEHGEMKLRTEEIDASALCARVSETHEPLAARKNITFSVVPPPAAITFTGDMGLLERVISNLVGNSLKFTPAGGTVSISCREVSGEAVFTVEDTGPGIPEDQRGEIFKKYSQMEEHKYMGFGLGLAMCKMAVELHKGRIWVESEVGKGSRFIFAIPLHGVYPGEAPAA
ncbi:MAG: ATP-binding protein [Elusimicrobiota bacterium]|nr:ATP-binding protein [Elusimicrobiota bacterium]